jgi:hypothetical protein
VCVYVQALKEAPDTVSSWTLCDWSTASVRVDPHLLSWNPRNPPFGNSTIQVSDDPRRRGLTY